MHSSYNQINIPRHLSYLLVTVLFNTAVYNPCLLVHSVVVLVASAWLASCLTVSPVWCSVARHLRWPVPLVILAGVFRMSPAYQCQVRPREGGRRAQEKG